MKKTKIGIVGTNTTKLFYPSSAVGFGGGEVQLHLLAHLLAEEDYEVEILMRRDRGIPSRKHYAKNIIASAFSRYNL